MMKKFLSVALLILVLLLSAVAPAFAEGGKTHYVKSGESLSTIASLYGVTPRALMEANGLHNPDFIYAGQKLIIPVAGDYGQAYSGNGYTVQAGDTLSNLAERFNTTVQALAAANNLQSSDMIYVGQVLIAPGGAGAGRPSSGYVACSRHYVVRWGDTLTGIAWAHGTTVEAIRQANSLQSEAIYEGQKLCLPGSQARPQPDQGQPMTQPKPAPKTPPPPDYTPHKDPPPKDVCEAPTDIWVDSQAVTVKAMDTWCPMWDFAQYPDGITAIVVQVTGRPGATVLIQPQGSQDEIVATTGDSPGFDADFTFRGVAPGRYRIWVQAEEASGVAEVDVPSGQRAWIQFKLTSVSVNPRPRAKNGWSGYVAKNTSITTPNNGVWSVIVVKGPAQGLPVRIKSEGGDFNTVCYTGQKPEYGPGACEFGGLWPGKYTLTVDGSGASVEVYVDGQGMAEIVFDPV
jgi:LysM repeat protein